MNSNIGSYMFILALLAISFVLGMKYAPRHTEYQTVAFERWIEGPKIDKPIHGEPSIPQPITVEDRRAIDSVAALYEDSKMLAEVLGQSYQTEFKINSNINGSLYMTSRPVYRDAILDSAKWEQSQKQLDTLKVPYTVYENTTAFLDIAGLMGLGAALVLLLQLIF